MESSNAAAVPDTATATAEQQRPPSKKQKVRRKPPPAETMARLPEESKLQTPMNAASFHGSGFLSEPSLTHRAQTAAADTAMPHQMQFIFSPRPRPMSQNAVVPAEARLPTTSDNILDRLHPIEHNETSIYSTSRQRTNEMDLASELFAPLPMGSSPLQHASMSASYLRQLGEINNRSHFGLGDAPYQSHILPDSQITRAGFHTSDALRSPYLGSASSRTTNFVSQHNDSLSAFASSQSTGLANHSGSFTALGTTPLSFPLPSTANQILEGMLRQQQGPQAHDQSMDTLVAVGNVERASITVEQRPSVTWTTRSSALQLPVILGRSTDFLQMNDHQAYLRQQIEVFQATQDDLLANTRGRNKRIHVGQVGIRCRHCAHIPAAQRQPGAVYFPGAMLGLYQAAQNMSSNHIQCGLCTEMPEDVKRKFVVLWPTRNRVSRAGARYWEEAATCLGLVDTEHGIAFHPNPGT